MATCRYCEKSGLTVRTDKQGVCKACSKTIQQDVEKKLAGVKEALVYIRCSKDPEVQESFCDVAMETVEKLATYEKRRLAEISPSPAAMLAMLRGKKDEAQAAIPEKPEVVRPVEGVTALLSHISEPAVEAGGTTAAAGGETGGPGDRAEPSAPRGETAWWAWEPPAGPGSEEPDSSRGEDRLPVDCLALLDPGSIRGSLQNISPRGLFLRSDTLHTPGRPVSLIISTAHGPAKARGVVRWVQADTLSGAEPGMGIEFTEVPDDLQTYLSTRLGCALAVTGPVAPEAPLGA